MVASSVPLVTWPMCPACESHCRPFGWKPALSPLSHTSPGHLVFFFNLLSGLYSCYFKILTVYLRLSQKLNQGSRSGAGGRSQDAGTPKPRSLLGSVVRKRLALAHAHSHGHRRLRVALSLSFAAAQRRVRTDLRVVQQSAVIAEARESSEGRRAGGVVLAGGRGGGRVTWFRILRIRGRSVVGGCRSCFGFRPAFLVRPAAGACGVPARTVGVAGLQASKPVGVALRPAGSPGCLGQGVAGAGGPGQSAGELRQGPGPSPSEELRTLWHPDGAPRAGEKAPAGRVRRVGRSQHAASGWPTALSPEAAFRRPPGFSPLRDVIFQVGFLKQCLPPVASLDVLGCDPWPGPVGRLGPCGRTGEPIA